MSWVEAVGWLWICISVAPLTWRVEGIDDLLSWCWPWFKPFDTICSSILLLFSLLLLLLILVESCCLLLLLFRVENNSSLSQLLFLLLLRDVICCFFLLLLLFLLLIFRGILLQIIRLLSTFLFTANCSFKVADSSFFLLFFVWLTGSDASELRMVSSWSLKFGRNARKNPNK